MLLPGPAAADSRAPSSSCRQDNKQQRRLALQKISSKIRQAADDPSAFPVQPPPRPPLPAAAVSVHPSPSPSLPRPRPVADAFILPPSSSSPSDLGASRRYSQNSASDSFSGSKHGETLLQRGPGLRDEDDSLQAGSRRESAHTDVSLEERPPEEGKEEDAEWPRSSLGYAAQYATSSEAADRDLGGREGGWGRLPQAASVSVEADIQTRPPQRGENSRPTSALGPRSDRSVYSPSALRASRSGFLAAGAVHASHDRHSRPLSSSRGRTASPAEKEEEAALFQGASSGSGGGGGSDAQEIQEVSEIEAEAGAGAGDDTEEAESAARYLGWLEDRWQLRLSSPAPPSSSSAVQGVLQELLRAEERFIQAYGLAALQRDIGFFSQ